MPIKVQCACGAAFAAKDELAGRTVKCPKCQQPLTIPAGGAMPAAAARAPAAAGAGRPMGAPLPSQGPPPGGGDLFAEAGLHTFQAGVQPCPGCAAPLPDSAVLCVKCGYNRKLGRRMETIKQVGGAPLPGGHTVTADELLNRAARAIEEDKEEEKKKTSEGMPWWAYLIGLLGLVGFLVAMAFVPQSQAMRSAGICIIILGCLVSSYSAIRLRMTAFSESTGHGFMYLFVPFYAAYYVGTRWDRCGGYVFMGIAGVFIALGGLGALFLADFMNSKKDDAYLPPSLRQPVPIVRMV
jgi:ribosomal protein L40E